LLNLLLNLLSSLKKSSFKKKEIEMEMINRDLQQELDDLKSSFTKLEKVEK
jgi:hypothetical protein